VAEEEAWKESPASSLTAMTHAMVVGMVAGRIGRWVFGGMGFLSRAATESDIVVDTTWVTIGIVATS